MKIKMQFLVFCSTLMVAGTGFGLNQKKLDKELVKAVEVASDFDGKESKSAVNKALTKIQLLIDKGASVTSSDHDLMLELALDCERSELLEILLKNGANPNQIINRASVLFEACSHQRLDLVKVLLKHGANPNQKFAGITPLIYSALRHHFFHPDSAHTRNEWWSSFRKRQKQIINVLIKNGADINAETGKEASERYDLEAGCTVLDCVEVYKDKELATFLMGLGARSSKTCTLSKK